MADVLEVTDESITREHVLKRLGDWEHRLSDLYKLVENWLPDTWRASRERSVLMDEEMMRRFDVGPRQLPALDLLSDDGRSASLEPRGLWIVGANGRIDLFSGDRHFVVVDKSARFDAPDWHIADFGKRRETQVLSRSAFLAALAV